MSKLFTKRNTKVGAKPGTLMIAKEAQAPRIRIIRFTENEHFDTVVDDVPAVAGKLAKPGVIWIDVQGMGSEKIIREIGELFSIHMLALESIVNVPQRPKTEAFDQHQLFISRMVSLDIDNKLDVEQVSILIGKNYVLTFQERFGDVLDPVRKRIKTKSTMMRKSGADYLAYAIIDTIIDGYYPVLEHYGEYLEELEARVVANASSNMLDKVNQSKRNMLVFASWHLASAGRTQHVDPGRQSLHHRCNQSLSP